MKNGEVFLINSIGENHGSDINRIAYFGRVLPLSEAEKVIELKAKAPDGWKKEVHDILASKKPGVLYSEKEQFEIGQMLTKEQVASTLPDPKLVDVFFEALYQVTKQIKEQLRRDKPQPVKTKV